jgi:DNA-directed RNA polymerase subunit RPC12/RpoP/predicted nucleic acid-binding Zn ribbon protein
MKRICDVCGGEIPENKRSDAKVCSSYCRVKKYMQTETGRRRSVEKTRRYQLSEKGQKVKKKADKKYYQMHKEKWLTDEKLLRSKYNDKARRKIRNSNTPYICIECGADDLKLDTHHIDEDWKNNDISNLEYRCKKCHNRIHGRIPWTVPVVDTRRKTSYTEDEIILYLKQAAELIGYCPFNQSRYTELGKGRPTAKTITKYKSWNEWMELIK